MESYRKDNSKSMEIRKIVKSRISGENFLHFRFALNDQRSFRVIGWLRTMMLHSFFPVAAQEIKTQAVMLGFEFSEKFAFKHCPLSRIQQALKH